MNWCVYILCMCLVRAVVGIGNSLKDPYICGSPTCIESEKFNYLQDVIYHYEYKTKVETYFAGSSNNRSTLDIRAEVGLQLITPCEGLLQLTNVNIVDQDENYPFERAEKFIHAVTQYELRFAYRDGLVSEICPNNGEEDWVLNFKRAILSLFQNSMKRFDIDFKGVEQDIHGTCHVDYAVRGQEGTSLVLVKTRDLNQCTNRYKYMSILQTVRYDFQSKFQTWPVLKSESKCVITVDHHVYKSVSCRERHLFEPFSGKNSGAMTTVVQDLVMIRESNKTDSEVVESQPKSWAEIQKRSNLLHHHTPYVSNSIAELKSARDVLILLCQINENTEEGGSNVDEKLDSGSTVGLWARLVRAARGLPHAALAQLLHRAPNVCTRATKHIMDALPYIASVGSVQLIKDMVLNNTVDNDTRHEWLMSMAMIPRPKLEMLESMVELLQAQKNDKVISFTASSMLYSYCKHSGKMLTECCEEETPSLIIKEFSDIVTGILAGGVHNLTRIDRNKLMVAIKSLGNIGGYKQNLADVLMNMIGDDLAPLPLRLTAVDAFRKTPCQQTREYFMETYRSSAVNIEVRIASYLQVMRCPDLSTIRQIVHTLKHEPVNQAATFVWSHLNNLGQSSLPSRVEIQGLLSGNSVPQLEDSPDFRMFSRNFEQSVFFDQYNAGGNYEANVIFSPDSYIPRSLSLNLTVDMFGESINILEMKGRAEGLESYFEAIFGDNGPLSKPKINKEIEKLRILRSTNNADDVRHKVDDLGYENEALKHRFPTAELGIKVFGNEISYWTAEGGDEIMKSLAKLNPQMRILEIFSGREISYNKASLFLDTTFSVPTGCGLPLNMNLMGTSYVNAKMSGTMVNKLSRSGTLDFEGKIRPSVSLSVSATMGVVAGGLASSGLRVWARLYTASALAARLALRGAPLAASLHLALPTNKQEIFAAKSELIILHGETEFQQQGLNQNRIEQKTCSWSAFDNAIGIKVCAAYQFPNMTNLQNAPYFLLSGPAKYIISLEKADPSANDYVFQFNQTGNNVSFSFDTPNSREKRMFNALVSFSNTSSTASVSFTSAQNTLKAHGLYRNLEDDKSLEVSLVVNGRKQFDTVMSVQRQNISHGYVWMPHAYWIVNDERVAELSGSVKVKSKGGVTQWDIVTDFQTKQLASRLVGYYTINGPTHGTKLLLEYEFYRNPKQTIKIEGVYSERILGYRHDLYGDLAMEFTAYPTLNYYAVLRNVRVQGHVDIGFNVSSSRDTRNTPALNFGFSRMDKLSGMKLDTHLKLVKPWPINMKYQFESIGSKYSVMCLLNFNPKSRDILVSGQLFYPPDAQLYADAELNMTLPTLHPCTLKAKLLEKEPHQYQLNAFGVWFTGVDFNVDALYQDQSKTNMASHRVKVLVNSHQFKDIAVDVRFTQDNRQITFVGLGEYNEYKYRTLIRYVLISPHNFTTYAELGIGERTYSVNLNADLSNSTDVSVDIHFDQLRDMHISYQRWLTVRSKRLSAAFKWDANRDPTQRVGIDVQLDRRPGNDWHHSGILSLYYPGRMIDGEFDLLIKDWFCEWMVRLGWTNDANVLWRVKLYSEARQETVYALLSSLHTPFESWADSSFNLMWRYHDNLQAINGSMNWQKDHLAFNLLADYLFKTNEFYGEINAIVNSTIPTLPKAAAIAKHRVIWKKSADTLLSFQYNEEGKLMINSSWSFDRGPKENNITGRVVLITPFQGYTNGFLNTHFVFGNKRDINGVTYLDLEEKVLKIYVKGHLRRITNCMLVVNATSPAAETALLAARVGFVEADRHLVAMVVTPNSTTGIEVLLKLSSLQDFNIYGHVALPIPYLNRAMVTAKRAPEEVDCRVGWDTMDFGFTGIWHYRSSINFVYVYKLYTPLEGFEENGLVLKNLYENGLDTELSIQLSKHKLGAAALLVDTGRGLLDALPALFHRNGNYDQFIENFDTRASLTLDTLYYPTITFHAHLIKFLGISEEEIVQVNATLHLPDLPPIVLTDIFVLEDFTTMRNTLNLVTPFQAIQEVKSVYTVDISIGEKTNVTFVALLYNGSYWHEVSCRVSYTYSCGEDDTYQRHEARLQLATPLRVLPALRAAAAVRLEDALWRMSADLAMPSLAISALGRLELDDPFVETSGSLNLTSDYLEDYFIEMKFKKDFSDTENLVGGGIQVLQGNQSNHMFAEVTWRAPPLSLLRVKGRLALWPVVSDVTGSLAYAAEPAAGGARSLAADVSTAAGESLYSLKADQRPTAVTVALATPHDGLRAMKLILEFVNNLIHGSLVIENKEYAIDGRVLNSEPLEMELQLVPRGGGQGVSARVSVTSRGAYAASARLSGAVRADLRAAMDAQTNYTDLLLEVVTPAQPERGVRLKARVEARGGLRRTLSVRADTPLPRLRHLQGDADFLFGPKTGFLLCNYELPDMKGNGDLKWSFLLGDLFIKAIGHQNVKHVEKSVDLDIFFGNVTSNTGLNTNNAGFRMDLDKIWQIGANASFGYQQDKQLNLVINAILPKPNVDVHTLYLDVDMGNPTNPTKALDAEYKTDVTKIITGVKGQMYMIEDMFDGNVSVIWTSSAGYRSVDNRVKYRWDVNGSRHVDYALISPLYQDQETLTMKGSYQRDMVHQYDVVKGVMHRPGSSQIGEVDVRYGGTKHTDGHFNITTPFDRLPWLRSIFNINNQEEHSDNKVHLYWPEKYASVNTTHQYQKHEDGFKQTGTISLLVPLSASHLVTTDYYYVQGAGGSNGNTTIDFDGERFLKGSFNQVLSKSERNLDLATSDIEVENEYTPVGVKYIHEYDVTGNTDVKQATVFHLKDASKFNVTGKIDIFTYDVGKNLMLTAIHGERTWTFDNKYEAVDKELKQGSKMTWAENVWFKYDIHVTNMTTGDTESQQVVMNVCYPLRTFNLVAVYHLQDSLLDGSAKLLWNVRDENKTAELKGRWENPPIVEGNLHKVDLSLAHPSFRKDVTLNGVYLSTPSVMSNISLDLRYSDYDNEYLKLKSILTDNSNGPIRDYKFGLTCTHPSTNLDLEMEGDIRIHSRWYYINDYYRLQKTLFTKKLKHNKLVIDLNNNLIQYERENETYFYKANGTWELSYPEYRVSGAALRPHARETAAAALSLPARTLVAHYNTSDDVSYHMVGYIPDKRSARLDAWRDYDDITTVDLASYIRLNHSRLLTTSFVWRPEIFAEVRSSVVYLIKQMYGQINETLVIVKEAPMEAHLALKNIWTDADPRLREFLNDLNDLHVIKQDLDDFEEFLNESYGNNDFYVKDIVEFTYNILDEMAIRNHLESLPGIVNDMWGMMGNTSQSIKQSLTYVVDTIKMAYSNFLSSVNKVLEADFMELISNKLEAMILQYDNFVRDLHMKLLEYWEATWVNATNRLAKYWHELLKSIEPLFFKILHYTESFVFALGKNVMDFFYNRTQELTDSPYFNYVSTFGHEMDKIYKDLMNNDLITNVKKYSRKLWTVIWTKIEKYIPFKDELSQLYSEFKNAWDNFLRTPQVVYVKEKYQEAYIRLKWWYDYFLIGDALNRVGEILYTKLTDMAKTALQYEELHRTPKTMFIFDPRKGYILLEQKLPMSWHAFNQTPQFSEIPEYAVARDFVDRWLLNNHSIWSYYYEIRPYMDINNVLPPFPGLAIMTGQGTLVTFDKRVLSVSTAGTYLLSRDYRSNNFTVLMESNDQGRYNLVVLTRTQLIHIDLYNEQVSLNGRTPLTLPTIVDGFLIDRQTEAFTVSGNIGLNIECNLLFKTCKMEVSGWYFACLGGLLGSFNNEQYDEPQLAEPWALISGPQIHPTELANDTQCEKFFQNKVSPLHPCFSVISAGPLVEACVSGVDACSLAHAYQQLCAQQHVPTHVPDHCMQCTSPQGDAIDEGTFAELQHAANSTDVVFVVEAQYCNHDLRATRNIDLLVEAFDSKLQDAGLQDNRYAIVGFGGSGVYSRPRALYVNNKVFTNSIEISQHFQQFVIDERDKRPPNRTRGADMFSALRYASSLRLRPAAPRALLLLPCARSRCAPSPAMDYSTIYHHLMENSITLHVLMDEDFVLSKRRASKYLFGVDSTLAYTNKDYERLVGDPSLRKQVKLPKDKLGLCTSLAMETNGTVFAGRKARAAAACARRPRCECRAARLACPPCHDHQHQLELSFWNTDDIDDIIDMAMDPPPLPTL